MPFSTSIRSLYLMFFFFRLCRLFSSRVVKLPASAEGFVKAHYVCGHGAVALNQLILK
jgi:hypothetical protein